MDIIVPLMAIEVFQGVYNRQNISPKRPELRLRQVFRNGKLAYRCLKRECDDLRLNPGRGKKNQQGFYITASHSFALLILTAHRTNKDNATKYIPSAYC